VPQSFQYEWKHSTWVKAFRSWSPEFRSGNFRTSIIPQEQVEIQWPIDMYVNTKARNRYWKCRGTKNYWKIYAWFFSKRNTHFDSLPNENGSWGWESNNKLSWHSKVSGAWMSLLIQSSGGFNFSLSRNYRNHENKYQWRSITISKSEGKLLTRKLWWLIRLEEFQEMYCTDQVVVRSKSNQVSGDVAVGSSGGLQLLWRTSMAAIMLPLARIHQKPIIQFGKKALTMKK